MLENFRLTRIASRYVKEAAYRKGLSDARQRVTANKYDTGLAYRAYKRGHRAGVREMRKDGWA